MYRISQTLGGENKRSVPRIPYARASSVVTENQPPTKASESKRIVLKTNA